MEGSPFNLFGDPEEFRARMEELSEQMQSSQRVAWADNAIKLAGEMTVASINRLDLTGSADQQDRDCDQQRRQREDDAGEGVDPSLPGLGRRNCGHAAEGAEGDVAAEG